MFKLRSLTIGGVDRPVSPTMEAIEKVVRIEAEGSGPVAEGEMRQPFDVILEMIQTLLAEPIDEIKKVIFWDEVLEAHNAILKEISQQEDEDTKEKKQ